MQTRIRITSEMVRQSQSEDDPWRLGNQVLYDLCGTHPKHFDDAEIVGKVWLIGRAYAASLERGRGVTVGPDVPNDLFYTKHLTKMFRASQLDKKLKALETTTDVNESNVAKMLDAHGYLVGLFEKLTSKGKRSLASKYLHFHRPNLFFIYDSRAMSSIRRLSVPGRVIDAPRSADTQYAQFVSKALGLRDHVRDEFGAQLSPRQFDRLLLATFMLRE